MDHTKLSEFLEKYHENPHEIDPQMIKNLTICNLRSLTNPSVMNLTNGLNDDALNLQWNCMRHDLKNALDSIVYAFAMCKEIRHEIQGVNDMDMISEDDSFGFDLGQLSSVDDNGNILSVDHREFINVINSIEELLELATELMKTLISTTPGYKGEPVNILGITEETADVETILVWIKTIFGLDEKDLAAIHEIKSARQMARLKITPGEYYDAISVMMHAEDHYVTQKIDNFAPLSAEFVNLVEEFKNKNQ